MSEDSTDRAREKAFHQALIRGDPAAVAKFLDEGFSANHRSENMPPMAVALSRGNVDLARLLLQRGYEINAPLGQVSGRTALMQAFECMSHGQKTPVAPIFELLLSAGADLNIRDKYGFTLAHIVAASPGDHSEILARLSTMGLELNVSNNYGDSPFIEAIRNGNLKCAEFLLQKGADVNQRGPNKKTALIAAGQRGLLEVCQCLVSKGADLHAKDEFNKTALDWARANGHSKVVEFLEQQLAAQGAPVASPVPPAPAPPGATVERGAEAGAAAKSGGFLRSLKQVFAPARKSAAEVPPPLTSKTTVMNVKQRIQESGRFANAACWCNQPMRLPVAGGGALELTPEEFIPYQFSFGVKAAGEEVDYLRAVVRLADREGTVWEGESIWRPGWFVGRMTDFGRISGPVPQERAGAALVSALEENWFVRGARDLLDDRFDRELFLAGQRYVVPFKYQAPVVDLAAHTPDEDDDCASAGVVVKVSGLYGFAGEESGEKLDLPAIVFTVDVAERLFVNYLVEEDEGAWGDQDIPELVTFRRTTLKGAANKLVQFRSGM